MEEVKYTIFVGANLVFALLQMVFVIRHRGEYKIQGEHKVQGEYKIRPYMYVCAQIPFMGNDAGGSEAGKPSAKARPTFV